MKINHISVSRDQCYKECQVKYKFRYHLNIKSPEPEQFYFTYGKIVHRAIELHTKNRGSEEVEKIASDLITGKIELQHGQKPAPIDITPEYKQALIRQLGHYKRLVDKIGFDGDIEWKFDMDMDGKGRILTGFIDRVIRKKDNFFLLDWKTTKPSQWRKDSRTITTDLQLQCYCYVVREKFKVPAANIEAALFFLDDNKLYPVRFSEKTLDSVPVRMLQVHKEIEETNPDKAIPNIGPHCKRCDYMRLCPFYNQL
jgi:CRISPR/Cas system-associated exonuclease Cas4 (RecB family)